MKYALGLLMCVLAVVSAQKEIQLPPNVIQTALTCLGETGVNPEILTQLLQPNFYAKSGDKRTHKYIHCTLSKLGFVKKNGHVRIDKVMDSFAKDVDNNKKAHMKSIIEDCNKENGRDPAETTYKIFGCFIKNSPVKLTPS